MAYLGSVAICLPTFGGPEGVCSPLEYLFDKEEPNESRWSKLVQSGSRLGVEFATAWNRVKRQAEQLSVFLQEEVPDILAPGPEGFGLGADWGARQLVVKEREKMLVKVMEKALKQYPDQEARPVKNWKNRCKLSTAFLLELPGPHNQWSGAEWGEALCLLLCLPPNCCRNPRLLGQRIGDRFVDTWGEEVSCANLPGGSWTRRHDRVKGALSSLAVYSNLSFECEPYALFAATLPQRPLHRLQAHQARQGLRPDFLFHLQNAEGNLEQVIADVKTVSLGNKDLYKPGYGGEKAVNLRAAKVGGEYRRDALKLDRQLGHIDGEGPTIQRLSDFPPVMELCFGAYGETSDGVKRLLDAMVDSKIRSVGLRKGSPGEPKEKAQVTSFIRRHLSSAVMRANVCCTLERMVRVGQGVGEAGKRRRWAALEEERARWSREAQWLVRVTGRELSRRGDITVI